MGICDGCQIWPQFRSTVAMAVTTAIQRPRAGCGKEADKVEITLKIKLAPLELLATAMALAAV